MVKSFESLSKIINQLLERRRLCHARASPKLSERRAQPKTINEWHEDQPLYYKASIGYQARGARSESGAVGNRSILATVLAPLYHHAAIYKTTVHNCTSATLYFRCILSINPTWVHVQSYCVYTVHAHA